MALSIASFAQTSSQETAHRVVIQFVNDDPQSQAGLMKNLKNLTTGWPELQIEVVCHGPGIFIIHTEKSEWIDEIQGYMDMGVEFIACENTMKGKQISETEIMPTALRVPMGIAHIILRQEAGWAYIKAGI